MPMEKGQVIMRAQSVEILSGNGVFTSTISEVDLFQCRRSSGHGKAADEQRDMEVGVFGDEEVQNLGNRRLDGDPEVGQRMEMMDMEMTWTMTPRAPQGLERRDQKIR